MYFLVCSFPGSAWERTALQALPAHFISVSLSHRYQAELGNAENKTAIELFIAGVLVFVAPSVFHGRGYWPWQAKLE